MARISNLEKARTKLDETMLNHEGPLTQEIAIKYFTEIAAEFNLDDSKQLELKGFSYQRAIEETSKEPVDPNDDVDFSHNIDKENVIDINYNEEHELTLEERFANLEERCINLENLVSRVAVLTGNGNHLKEYGVERWEPGKKHMNKYAS